MTESTPIRRAALGATVGAAVVLLLGVDIWQHSGKDTVETTGSTVETSGATESTTTSARAPEPATCGKPRTVTVEESTPVVWELVRESDSVTSACPRVTLYRDKESVSTFELPDGATYIDGDDGLWSYREGAAAMPEDQSVNSSEQSAVWLIARTSDGRTVSANLDEGQLSFG